MAYGTTNRYDGRSISAKFKTKDKETFLEVPYFLLTEKQGDEYLELTKEQLKELTGNSHHPLEVDGDLIEVSTRVGEFEGKPVRSFKVVLEDKKTKIRNYVDFTLGSSVAKSVANCLLNLAAFNDVRLGCYGQPNKLKGKTYPACSVRQGDSDETVKWKYDPKAKDSVLPPPREFEGRTGIEKDFTKQEVFFIEKLNEFAKVVEAAAKSGNASAPKAASTTAPKPATVPTDDQGNTDSDVPF